MKKLIIGLLTFWSACAAAQTPTVRYTPLGYQQITTLTSATLLTVPTGANCAFISVESAAVRYRDDGTAPTASIGMPLAITSNGPPLIYCGTLSAIQFIQQASSATLNVLYYRISG
jgi:hypothetical protein